MLYFLYEWLARSQEHVPALNLLKYLTFRSGMAMLTGCSIPKRQSTEDTVLSSTPV